MERVHTTHERSARAAPSRLPRLVAIVALLSCCLALAGPPMRAGTLSSGTSATETRTSIDRSVPDRPAFVALADRLHAPLAALPAHSAELAGLFVLGLSLLGAGRYLRRGPATRRRIHSVSRPGASEGTAPRTADAERLATRHAIR